jgi:hypothetical protein
MNLLIPKGYPTRCCRCGYKENSAEGYYGTPGGGLGICRLHRRHGGSKITWYKPNPNEFTEIIKKAAKKYEDSQNPRNRNGS